MRVLIATTQVPFIQGGAELLASGLRQALMAEGHEAEIVAIPFKWYPPERIVETMLACRLLDLTESAGARVDRVIGLKFPAYLIPHPNKTLWLVHQHRSAYDLWEHKLCDLKLFRNGADVREAILQADRHFIPEASGIFTISKNVTARLEKYCDIASLPLYHPPQNATRYFCAAAEDYLFFPSRLSPMKRQSLVLEALAETSNDVCIRFAGAPENRDYADQLKATAAQLNVQKRVQWLGTISEEEKQRQYAHALGIVYPPLDEDFGYVTLEAMLASKPVITCVDSGGPLEFVRHQEMGLVAEPSAASLAVAFDTVWENRKSAAAWGRCARSCYDSLDISWPHVVTQLLA
jgi:glycosyltransferase involved in cell wall biosynthesis